MFVVLEGPDGAGKTSQAKAVAEMLRDNHKIHVVEVRAPGSTNVAESIRTLLKTSKDLKAETTSAMLLMMTAQLDMVNNVIKPYLTESAKHHTVVLCDRYVYSTFVYQGIFNNVYGKFKPDVIDEDKLLTLKLFSDMIKYFPMPNLVVYLKTSLATAVERTTNIRIGHGDEATWEDPKNTGFLNELIDRYDELFDSWAFPFKSYPEFNYLKDTTTPRVINTDINDFETVTKHITEVILANF